MLCWKRANGIFKIITVNKKDIGQKWHNILPLLGPFRFLGMSFVRQTRALSCIPNVVDLTMPMLLWVSCKCQVWLKMAAWFWTPLNTTKLHFNPLMQYSNQCSVYCYISSNLYIILTFPLLSLSIYLPDSF